jgi:protein phosphatase 1L
MHQVVDNQIAVDLVRKTKDPKTAAKQLVDYAISQNSKDDISCIVVRLQ